MYVCIGYILSYIVHLFLLPPLFPFFPHLHSLFPFTLLSFYPLFWSPWGELFPLPVQWCCLTPQSHSNESSDKGLKLLKPWARINPLSFSSWVFCYCDVKLNITRKCILQFASAIFLGWKTFILCHLRLKQIVQREGGAWGRRGQGRGEERRKNTKSELGVEHFFPTLSLM